MLDYVIVHELTHLVHADHSPAFNALVDRYPRAERARGYLMATSERTRPPTSAPIATTSTCDDTDGDDPDDPEVTSTTSTTSIDPHADSDPERSSHPPYVDEAYASSTAPPTPTSSTGTTASTGPAPGRRVDSRSTDRAGAGVSCARQAASCSPSGVAGRAVGPVLEHDAPASGWWRRAGRAGR